MTSNHCHMFSLSVQCECYGCTVDFFWRASKQRKVKDRLINGEGNEEEGFSNPVAVSDWNWVLHVALVVLISKVLGLWEIGIKLLAKGD